MDKTRLCVQVTTSDYTNLTAKLTHPRRLRYVHPDDLMKTDQLYDLAVSFSSLEHTGLGRYGDPFNFIGDLQEMARLSCVVRPGIKWTICPTKTCVCVRTGGLLLIGVPVSADGMQYNLHRYYGPRRLSMMIECWHLIDYSSDLEFRLHHHHSCMIRICTITETASFQSLCSHGYYCRIDTDAYEQHAYFIVRCVYLTDYFFY